MTLKSSIKKDKFIDAIGHTYEDKQHFLRSNEKSYPDNRNKREYAKLSTSEKVAYWNYRKLNYVPSDAMRKAKELYKGD